jgi:hypothetical protein
VKNERNIRPAGHFRQATGAGVNGTPRGLPLNVEGCYVRPATDVRERPMKIGVIHRISDPETAQSRGQTLFEEHEGVQLLQFCPSQDFREATCIWEASSVDTVRDLVDPTLGDASDQTYFAVATEQAVGLPDAAATTAR